MIVVLSSLWLPLVLAMLLGLGVGWLTGLPQDRAGLVPAGALLASLGILAGLVLSQEVPGVAGFWIETAAALLCFYVAGCVLAGTGRACQR